MKKITILLLAYFAVTQLSARSLNVTSGNVTYSFQAATMGHAIHNPQSSTLTILGKEFAATSSLAMTVVEDDITDNQVYVNYNGSIATAIVAGNIARYVDISIEGADVSISQSDLVTSDTCGEITYILSGSSECGSFAMTGSYKASIELQGLILTNPSGAAIDIQNGKRISLSAKNETVNVVTDGNDGTHKGAINCKGHLELKGKGILTVAGKKSHAIYAKEYVSVQNLTLNVTESVKDGINCSQYFLMESGTVSITGVGDDGVQVDYKDTENRETEDTGSITILGGTLTTNVTATAAKGIKAEGDIAISGGTITISVSGGGEWNSTKLKTKASSCINSDQNVTVTGGDINLKATGSGGKGISCDGTFKMVDGDLKISTSGGIFAYVNGTAYDDYTGNTDRLDSDYKSSPKGVKADTYIQIDGGNINILTTGRGAEGIESKGELTINNGTIYIKAYDDAINSSSHLNINGGTITVIATNNDGLDSNGNLYINGGYIMAFGASAPECGIDANSEEGYTVIFTGGTLIAVGGGNNSLPTTDESTQPYVGTNGSAKAGTTITLKNGDTVLAQFIVPDEYSGSSGGGNPPFGASTDNIGKAPGGPGGGPGGNGSNMVITCPGLTTGSSYTLVNRTTSISVTATLKSSGGTRPW